MYRDIKTNIKYNLLQLDAMLKAFEADPEVNPDPSKIKVHEEVCGKNNVIDVSFEEFEVVYLSDDIKLDDDMDFPRCKHLPGILAALVQPEYSLMVQSAQWLREGATIPEKLDLLEISPVSLTDRLAKFSTEHTYGVSQTVTKMCTQCGKEQQHSFPIIPDMFFRV